MDLEGSKAPLYRCSECKVVHWGSVWEHEKPVEYYHDYYAGKTIDFDPITEARYHSILTRIEQHVSPGRILDVGCGMGHFLAVSESRKWQAMGLEMSDSGIKMLERVKLERGLRFEICGGDLLRNDFAANSFRAVTLFEVLEHLIDPMAVLRKIHTLLEPNGMLYLTTPNFDSLSRYALAGRWRAITEEHLHLFTPWTMRACLSAAGFRPISLVTKNVDVPEIIAKWRRRNAQQAVNTLPSTRAFRRTIEGSPWLQRAKRCMNVALRLSSLGETIEVFAVKA
jgi:2-polyprenyl-3-methyl-5-hydroxy-6-metoxy-1,4-benzoquinol methylase